MFQRIMVPIDLAHIDQLARPLQVAADAARHYGAEVWYVAVTSDAPGSVARTPRQYQQKLDAFVAEQSTLHGQPAHGRVLLSPDPVADLDDVLIHTIKDLGADLVIMGTHLRRHLGAVMPSHGGKVATHTKASVFLVRPQELSR
ncbi:MAG: universal stress protein [Actinomycetota bacterium]